MTNRTWISDNYFDITEQTPMDIEQTTTDNVIECTGWWKAGDFDTAQWVADKGVGDDEYYITQWDDSSGNGNHLVDEATASGNAIGQGPRAYGGGANEHGSVSDEVGNATETFPVVHFENITGGEAQGQLYLVCVPDVSDDFGVKHVGGEANPKHITWVIMGRHHQTTAVNLAQPFVGNLLELPMGGSITSKPIRLMAYSTLSGSPTTRFVSDLVPANSETNESFPGNTYKIMCMTATREDGNAPSGNYEGMGIYAATYFNSYFIPYDLGTWDSSTIGRHGTHHIVGGTNMMLSCGKGHVHQSGGSGVPDEENLDGRIVEMACWKSDSPIPMYKRAGVFQYFKNKFSADI